MNVPLFLVLLLLLFTGCSGGSGTSSSSSGISLADLSRTFSAGATPVTYTAVVHQVSNTGGAQISVPAIGAQTAFQYFNTNISQAVSAHAALVSFPKGNYSIAPESGAQYHININAATDLIIDGNGSTLTFTGVLGGDTQGTIQGITITSSTRVLLRNFILDYDVRIASSGTVQSESSHCSGTTHNYVLINTATYPMTDTRIQQAKLFNDSTTNLWGSRANEYYTYNTPVNLQGGNGFYPCSSSFDTAFPTTGHTVTVRHFAYDGNAIGIYGPNTQDVTLQGLTLYSSPAMGIYVDNVPRGIAIENVSIVKNPNDSTRLVTLAADGIHFDQVGGDILIENSEVSFQGDDGLNIVTKMTSGTTLSGATMTVSNTDANAYGSLSKTGNTFGFYSPTFSSLGTAILQSVAQAATTVLTFNSLTGFASGDWMINQSLNTTRVYFSGNNFHDNRERGVMARSTGMWIGNSTFSHNSGPAVLLATDGLYFNEGAFAQDVTIQSNTITAANQTQSWASTIIGEYGAISMGVLCPTASGCTNTLAPSSPLQNILVQNNSVSATAGLGLLISNVTNASVSGNTITDTSSTILQSSFGGPGTAAGSIHSTRSSGVGIGTNTVSRAATSN